MTITKAEIAQYVTLTPADVTEVYDGEAHAAGRATATDEKGNDLKIEYQKADGSWTEDPTEITATNVSESKTVNVRVSSEGNYKEYVTGTEKLTITKKAVTLTSADASKVYDGKALEKKEVKAEGFVEGEGATYDKFASQTEVGSCKNTFEYTLEANTKAGNYEITSSYGTLTVTAQSIDPENPDNLGITIDKPSDHVYDGKDHKWVPEVKDKDGKELKAGTDYTVSYSTENFKDVQEITVTITGEGNYAGTVKKTYKITKKAVTLTSADASKVYDGKALEKKEVKAEGFVEGEGATYDKFASQTEVGSCKNTFEYTLEANTKAGNYEITSSYGTLTVTAQSIDPENPDNLGITIDKPSDHVYDGKDHKWVPEVKDKDGKELKAGTDYTVSYSTENFKDVQEITVTITGEGNYAGTVTKTYQITKRYVTLISASDSKAYDGKALTNDEVTVGGDKFAEGEGAEFTVTGSQLDAGTSDNVFEYALKDGTNADNYTIEVVYGKLTVTADENEVVVTITENRGRNKYDGRKHKVTGYEVTDISNKLYTAKDFTFNGKAEVTGTDAGTYNMNVKAADFENTNANFDKVTFVIIDGTLTIEKRNVTMTSANASKQYDGNALTNNKVTVSGDGFAKGEGATYDVTGTRTNTGTSKNTFTYTLKNGTKAANYNIKKVEGKLTITAAPVTPSNTQNTPANPTPQNRNVVQRVVTSVRNVPSRIARAVQETGAKVRELVNAGDNNVPLGNQKLDDHKCCVLHFLIMLLTAILYGFFTHNLKKRQKKLFEVREELDTELAKRGLPTTKEQKQQ